MSKLNFAIALKMTTDQFKKGADIVKSGIRSIQYQVLGMASALGLGRIGLKNLVSRFIDVARETNRARVALKNISGDANQFAANQKYLIGLSREYGQGLNIVTSNFAKFSAAANSAGVSIEGQKKIFTEVSRSITAFALNSDDANGVFLALSQMMSKGKISAEELRGQLGERLPIAMAAMAKAAGVPISELDSLMKKGKLLSADILPKFAEALSEMVPNIDTDNLETSLTRLRNKFIELTESLNIGGKYKGIVDSVSKGLDTIKENISGLVAFAISMFSGKLLTSFTGYLQKIRKGYFILAADRELLLQKQAVAEGEALRASLTRMEAEQALDREKNRQKMLSGRIAHEDQKALLRAETSLRTAQAKEHKALILATAAQQKAAAVASGSAWAYTWVSFRAMALRAIASVKALLITIAPMVIVTVISIFISKLVQARKEAKRISDIFGEYKREMTFIGGGEEAARLRALVDLMNDQTAAAKDRNAAQSALLGMLNMEKGTQQEITDEVGRRIELLKEAARADLAARKFAEAEEANRRLSGKTGLSVEQMTKLAENRGVGIVSPFSKDHDQSIKYQQMIGSEVQKSGNQGKYSAKEIDKMVGEFAQNLEILSDSGNVLKQAELKRNELTKNQPTTPVSPTDPNKDKETDLQKAEREYTEKLRELSNKKESSVITTDEYNKSVDALNEATRAEIGGILGREAVNNETFNKANAGTLNKLYKENKEAVEIEKYTQYLKEQNRLKERGIISEEEYKKRVQEITKSTLNAIGVLDSISDEGKKFIEGLKSNIKPDKKEGEHDGVDADGLNKKSKKIKREVFDEIKSGISDVTSLTDAFQSLNDVLNDTDASGLEKTRAVVDGILETIDRVWSFIESIDGVKDALQSLNEVKSAQKALGDADAVTKQVDALGDLGNAASQTAMQVVSAKTSEATANTAAAATGAAASVASIPIAGPAMAVAAVASILAALANLPEFASVVVVPGNSTHGDKILTRLNSGELVLNKAQQAVLSKTLSGLSGLDKNLDFKAKPNLFNHKQSVSFLKELKFEIEGRKLVGILKQEGALTKRI
jgi:tape measure domain-containing protein